MEENAKKRRIFIALNLPREIKKDLAEALVKLSGEVGGVKWVKPDGLHLTLHFLGYLDEPQIEKVMAVMDELAKKFGSMNFEAGGIGAFPALTNPRVFFLDCRQTNGRTVYEMQKKLGEKLSENGFTIDSRPWQAHLTLGRVKGRLSQSAFSLSRYEKIKNKNFTVKSFELMESKLRPDGAAYKVVMSYKFPL